MFRLIILITVLLSAFNLYAAERIVVLSPSVADIVVKLGFKDNVVGITKSVEGFGGAVKVGSHIRPNTEIIKSLRPDLVIISSNRFFTDKMASEVDADVMTYSPDTLTEILSGIQRLADKLGVSEKGKSLTEMLAAKLTQLEPVKREIRTVYEVSYLPYMIAGGRNIVSDIIDQAGGVNVVAGISKNFVKTGAEGVFSLFPELYIYQVGPMNKRPPKPDQRRAPSSVKRWQMVDEKQFARANTNAFDNVVFLNKLYLEMQK